MHLKHLENQTMNMYSIQMDINLIHHRITTLAMYGESVIIWSKSDYDNYSEFRSETDSLLVCLKQSAREFVLTEQIDTLRQQLLQKEFRLRNLMNIIQRENITDSILESRIHSLLTKSSDVQKFVRKRKGLAGLFGKKIRYIYLLDQIFY